MALSLHDAGYENAEVRFEGVVIGLGVFRCEPSLARWQKRAVDAGSDPTGPKPQPFTLRLNLSDETAEMTGMER